MEDLIIVGAGPAGLTAGWEAASRGLVVKILEKDPQHVGGISRTAEQDGYRFDIGGHRFFSKNTEIVDWWQQRLPDDFIEVSRLSRIYFNQRFFKYPLEAFDALLGLGFIDSSLCILSYLKSRILPIRPEQSFEDWVVNRFGRKLFETFFRTYTEKVWGIPCDEISKDWAAQRIKGFSLSEAIAHALAPNKSKSGAKTLIDRFAYPRLGPGQLWQSVASEVGERGSAVTMGKEVTKILRQGHHILGMEVTDLESGAIETVQGHHYLVSMPLQDTILKMDPPPDRNVVAAAEGLRYRDFLTVALVVEERHLFDDQWIYIHDPSVRVGRIQNFLNWSESLIADDSTTCLGMEYFCLEGDDFWKADDEMLIELAKNECQAIGLVPKIKIRRGFVVRMPKAYPVYRRDYEERTTTIKTFLNKFDNLQPIGRNGLHKYNNQDHSMLTAMLAVRNIESDKAGASRVYDVWKVNGDAEYIEKAESSQADASGRQAPTRRE